MNINIDVNIKPSKELVSLIKCLGKCSSNISLNQNSEKDNKDKELDIKTKIGQADEDKKTEVKNIEKTEVKSVTLEDVRGLLAKLAKDGKQKEVKDLIKKFGATKLTEVASENYEALLKEAEEI